MALALGLADDKLMEAASPGDPPLSYSNPLTLHPGEHSNSTRAIWYPKLSEPAKRGQARCGAHSDTGALTLLYADSPGLEVVTSVSGN